MKGLGLCASVQFKFKLIRIDATTFILPLTRKPNTQYRGRQIKLALFKSFFTSMFYIFCIFSKEVWVLDVTTSSYTYLTTFGVNTS